MRKGVLIYELLNDTIKSISSDQNSWKEYLDFSARLYKYPFKDQVLIYAQRPDATAVADIDIWNKSMHCWVRRGAKGIALLDDSGYKVQLRYVFDVSDVRAAPGEGRKPILWQMNTEYEPEIMRSLSGIYPDLPVCESLTEQLHKIADQLGSEVVNQSFDDIKEMMLINQQWSDQELKVQFQESVTNSICYTLHSRCGISPGDLSISFPYISHFNLQAVLMLGSCTSQVCMPVLSEIGKTVFREEKNIAISHNMDYNTLKRESEGETQYKEDENGQERNDDISSGRRLSDPGSEFTTRDRTGANDEPGIRTDEKGISDGRKNSSIRQPATNQSVDAAPGINSARSRSKIRGNHKTVTSKGERDRSFERIKSHSVGEKDESVSSRSKRDSNSGDYSQLSLFPSAEEQQETIIQGSSEAAADPPDSLEFQKVEQIAPEAPIVERNNFRLTGHDLEYIRFSPKQRCQANIEAIKLLYQIESRNSPATIAEKTILSKYAGWGGIQEVFDPRKDSWKNEYEELKSLLPKDQYVAARASTLNAHYTSPSIIDFMYQIIGDFGLNPVKIIEPAVGSGNFIGRVPERWKDSSFYCSELDSTTGRIAKLLYPDAQIEIKGYEETTWQDNSMDLAVGNVPFGQYQVYDRRYKKEAFEIHDYFFAKSIDLVNPGGMVAFVTSKGTFDKKNSAAREYIAKRAELITAVRLPNNAFKAQAGTSVTSDILFFRKRPETLEQVPDEMWLKTEKYDTINDCEINRYFIDHPDRVLGDLKVVSGQYGMELTCEPIADKTLSEQLAVVREIIQREKAVVHKERSKHNDIPADRTELFGQLSQCTRDLIDMQLRNCNDVELKVQQDKLNLLYERFTQQFGLINSKTNSRHFSKEDSYYLLCSLEILNEDGTLKRKSDVFNARTIQVQQIPESVDTANEALAISLDQKGKIDLDYMSELCSKSTDEITKDLKGVIFKDPISREWETADEYLSGNVRNKLGIAKNYAERETDFEVNVRSLELVQPKDLTAAEIEIRLGATWVEPKYVMDFIKDTFAPRPHYINYNLIDVSYSEVTGQWNIKGKNVHDSVISNVTFGTKRANAYKLLELALNLKEPQIFDTVDVDGKETRVLNKKETILASQKQELIKERYKEWIFKDPERRETLCKLYNEKFNSIRPREFDGSHLTFPGMSPLIELRQHQKNGVARNLYGKNTLYAHCVGAGKTFTMTAAAMESKRIGLCNKSIFVVPNHLIGQWAKEVLMLYPGANILASTKKDFEPANRKKFCSRIATGNYDIVIIGHSQFEKIPISKDRQQKMINNQIESITDEIENMKLQNEERFTIKQMEKTRKTLDVRLKKLNDIVQDNVITFEQLGVDRLFVDEAHHYKNLFLYTKMRNVAGISQTEALKSTDMYNKCQYIDEITGGTGIAFATGTPISNSMTEMYTMMRYLQSETLNQLHLNHFDSWASIFGETVTAIELAPEGTGYRMKTRFAKFFNLPELMSFFKECADIQTADMLKLPVPEAVHHNVAVKPSEFQQNMLLDLANRAESVRNGAVDPRIDNMLKITNDGRKLALDQRTIVPDLPRADNAKSVECCKNIKEIWEQTSDLKSTQLVFCDLSTPSATKNVQDEQFKNIYEDMKQLLTKMDIPEKEIAFIHDANTDLKKSQLFAKVRTGEVRVLLGSTSKMGAGTNVQDKLIAIHRLDVPWRPSDIEQSEGRGIRQGNENPQVHIYRYVTEGTFDSYSWQLIENKQKFISQIMTSRSPLRTCEDIDESILSYAEVKALATGNPYIKEKMDLDVQVSKLKMLQANDTNMKYQLEDQINKEYPQAISRLSERISGLENDLTFCRALPVQEMGKFEVTLKGMIYIDKKDAGVVLNEICKGLEGKIQSDPMHVGNYKGFNIFYKYDNFWKRQSLIMKRTMSYEIPLLEGSRSFSRMDEKFDNDIGKEVEELKSKLTDKMEQLENAKVELKKPFPYSQELKEKTERLEKLDMMLNQDDDLMKKKAAAHRNAREVGIEIC